MDNIAFDYVVLETDDSMRIDRFLSLKLEGISRSLVQRLIDENKILVNSNPVKSSYKVKNGDLLEVCDFGLEETDILPVNIPLEIVYEDEELLVINKPSGMVVHPAPGHYQDTLVNGLLWHIKHLSNSNGSDRPGIIHRIDKDTSGLLMVAKNNEAHDILAKELQAKKTKREYLALVEGVIVNKRGRINAPIGRDRSNRLKMDVVASGKEAITNFEVVEVFEDTTLVRCILETGRTHQIRVHMNYIKHPVFNDPVYSKNNHTEFGQFLHAEVLGFTHPKTKQWMEFKVDLPIEFSQYLNKKRIKTD
jgi:23S rRNA pseudouridine1911/1915/1917 synthase